MIELGLFFAPDEDSDRLGIAALGLPAHDVALPGLHDPGDDDHVEGLAFQQVQEHANPRDDRQRRIPLGFHVRNEGVARPPRESR